MNKSLFKIQENTIKREEPFKEETNKSFNEIQKNTHEEEEKFLKYV